MTLLLGLSMLLPPLGSVAARAAKADSRELKREMALDAANGGGGKRDKDFDAKGGKPRPEDAMTRGLARLRELLEVTDDAEWDIIGERIARVAEARGSLGKGAATSRGGPSLPEKTKKVTRGVSAHPEQEALRLAVKDKLPDAEIKARLDRAHELLQQNEARLAKAEADLRAVLTVRQEAIVVLAGLLPP